MPTKQRLSRKDFVDMSRKSVRRVSGALFSLSITPLSEGSAARAAIVVSKKVSPKAAARNLLRRRSREVLRPLISRIGRSVALVFHAKAAARDASFAEIKTEIARLIA